MKFFLAWLIQEKNIVEININLNNLKSKYKFSYNILNSHIYFVHSTLCLISIDIKILKTNP